MTRSADRGTILSIAVAGLALVCPVGSADADSRWISALQVSREADSMSPVPLRPDSHSNPLTIGDLNNDGLPELAQIDYQYLEAADGGSAYGGPTTVRLTILYSPFIAGQMPAKAGFRARVIQTARRGVFGDVDLVRDISGDGIPEIVVSDPSWPRIPQRRDAGIVRVIFGRTDGSMVKTGESPGWGYSISGAGTGAFLGHWVDAGRDVNGDRIGDLVISAGGNDRSTRGALGLRRLRKAHRS